MRINKKTAADEVNPVEMPSEKESAQSFIRAQWKIIRENKNRFFIPTAIFRNIDEYIDIREKAIIKEILDPRFDWSRDLYMATIEHKYNMDWFEKVDIEHKAYIDYWKSICASQISTGEKLVLAGLNTIYLVHGAVAVGALNALASKQGVPEPGIASAAKLAMPSALVGIALVSTGQIVLAKFGTEMSNRVAGKLIGTVALHRARTFPRYWERYRKKILRWGDALVYASVVWFFIYSMACYLVILNN